MDRDIQISQDAGETRAGKTERTHETLGEVRPFISLKDDKLLILEQFLDGPTRKRLDDSIW